MHPALAWAAEDSAENAGIFAFVRAADRRCATGLPGVKPTGRTGQRENDRKVSKSDFHGRWQVQIL
jgi:hypothetical protein